MDLLEAVRATGLLPPDRPVVVLLSGGRDSVCLLDVATRLAAEVTALHVDHGLRPEAAADAAGCRALCARLGVPLEVQRARRPPAAGNVQAWAREARYAAGGVAAARRGALLATGHTATDQAETVLYRLAAAPSRRALLGMAPQTSVAAAGADVPLVRPLLGVTREQTRAHCLARGLPWVEDSSNTDDRYARARVRHGLAEALARVHPAAERNVVRLAALLREEGEVLDELVDTVVAGHPHVALEHLRMLSPALARLVLRRLAEDAVGGLCPRVGGRLDDVLELSDDAMLDLGDGARAVVAGGVLRFERTPPLPGRAPAGH